MQEMNATQATQELQAAAVAAGFDFSVIVQLVLKVLGDPELLALIKKLFGA